MSEIISEPALRKKQDRKAAAKRRTELHVKNSGAGEKLAAFVMAGAAALGLQGGRKTVSVFWSMGSEIDTQPLLQALHAAGHATALPIVGARAQPLIFRAWAPGEALVDGGFGTSIPSQDADVVLPDVLFVPLLAFDDDGYRLGYGGGFYDRTLEKLRASDPDVLAIGVAFYGQRVDTVPRGPYDQPLDGVVTENGLIRFDAKGVS